MATTKKTTKKKTTTAKTKKKSPTKARSKSSAKVAEKSSTKKLRVSPSAVERLYKQLNSWNWALGILYAIGGIFVLTNSSDIHRTVTTSYVTNDTIVSSDGSSSLVPAVRGLFDANITYMVAGVLFIAAVSYLLRASLMRTAYEARLREEHGALRWLEYGIGTGLLFATIGLIAGVNNVAILAAMFIATCAAARSWRIMESMNHGGSKTIRWCGLHVAMALKAIPWVIIGVTLWSQRQYSDAAVQNQMYWLAGSAFVLMLAHASVMRTFYRNRAEQTYLNAEWMFIVVNFILIAAVSGQIYFWLLQK